MQGIRPDSMSLDLLARHDARRIAIEPPLPAAQPPPGRLGTCQLRLLGDLSLIIGGREAIVGQGIAEVLALLGIAGPMSRKRMQATLWPSSDPLLTTGRLRSLVYRARQLFGTDLIMSDPPSSIGLNLAVPVDFRVAVDAAAGVQQGLFPAPAGLHGLTRLLGSELLPLCSWEWLEQYQHSWSRTRLRALIACAHEAARIRDHETVITACEEVILAEPFHEQAHYLMINEMLLDGYENTARETYGRLRRLLADELGCLPRCSYEELRTTALARVLTCLGSPERPPLLTTLRSASSLKVIQAGYAGC